MTLREVYSAITIGGNPVDIISVEVSEGHRQTTSSCNIEVSDISGINLNDEIVIDIGYSDEHGEIFRGYVDQIGTIWQPGSFSITGRDILKMALENFIVSTDLDNPWSRENISAEALVGDLLGEAHITNYSGAATGFTFGTQHPAEFNLMSSWDAINTICNILAYNCFAENDTVYFQRIFPVPSGAASHAFTVGNSGDLTVTDYQYNTDNLRNKVIVFGLKPIYAEASAASPYLPADFYKTAVISSELIDTQGMADDSADYNLDLYNKLTENLNLEAEGDYRVRVRDTVSVTEPFIPDAEGDWFVFALSHRLAESSGYTMSMTLSR